MFLSEGAGDEWKTPIEAWKWGSVTEPLYFYNHALRLQKNPFLNIKLRSTIDRVG